MYTDKKQIYIIDDDISVCRSLSILLRTYGFSADTFTSTDKFLEAVPRDAFGCLILDIHMPEFDGWKTLQHLIVSGYNNLPVIIISADKKSGLNERALKAGAMGYLQKPFNDQALVDLINVAMKDKKERRAK